MKRFITCILTFTLSLSIHNSWAQCPTIYDLSGDTTVKCAYELNVTLSGSEVDNAYYLEDTTTGAIVSPTVMGTGSAINFDLSSLTSSAKLRAIGGGDGFALSLDGANDYVNVSHDAAMDLTNQFIISFWFRSTDLTQTNNYVLGKGANRYAFLYGYAGSTLEFFAGGYSGDDPRSGSQIAVNDTNWHHYMYAYDGTTFSGYMDSTEVFSMAKNFTLATDANDLFLGSANASVAFTKGELDNLEMWNQYDSLRASDLRAGTCDAPTSTTGLILRYNFNEGIGTTVSDLSGPGIDGSLMNGASWASNTICAGCYVAMNNIVSVNLNPGPPGSITSQPMDAISCEGDSLFYATGINSYVDSVLWQQSSSPGVWFSTGLISPSSKSSKCDSIYLKGYNWFQSGNEIRALAYQCGVPVDTSLPALMTIPGFGGAIAVTGCDFYASASGKVYTETGFYGDTIVGGAENGCDSVRYLFVDLFSNRAPHRTIIPSVCENFVAPSGKIVSGPNIVYDTIVGADPSTGCDSIILINFKINCDTITEFRMLGATWGGSISYHSSVDSQSFTSVSITDQRFYSLFENPLDGMLYGLMDSLTTSRDLYRINPFNGEVVKAYDISSSSFISTADVAPTGEIYYIHGNDNPDAKDIYRIDAGLTSETYLFTTAASQRLNLEYYEPNQSVRIYSHSPEVYEINLGSNTETYVETMGFDASSPGASDVNGDAGLIKAAFYNPDDTLMYLYDWDGNVFRSDSAGVKGHFYFNNYNSSLMDITQFHTLFPAQDTVKFCIGDSAMLNTRYQANQVRWFRDGVEIASNVDTIYTTVNGTYRALHQIGNLQKWVWSEEKVVIEHVFPTITISSVNNDSMRCPLETINLLVAVSTFSYEWYKDGVALVNSDSIGFAATSSGNYSVILTTAEGCTDSSALDWKIIPDTAKLESITVQACDSLITPSGMVLSTTGIFNDTIQTALGCDSIITIDLTINNTQYSTEMVSTCDSLLFNGILYTSSILGPKDTLVSSAGCDSIVTLDLTILKSSDTTMFVTACDSFIWSTNGLKYDTTGVYTHVIPNAAGCDSVITLNLTINSTTYFTVTTSDPTTCGASDGWMYFEGTATPNLGTLVYSDTITGMGNFIPNFSLPDTVKGLTQGDYIVYFDNGNGCPVIADFNYSLIDPPTTYDTINTQTCTNYTAPSGAIYDSTGTYMDTIPNSTGCDSIITINLTISDTLKTNIMETACDSFMFAGIYRTMSGIYLDSLITGNGCDSIVTLDLTVNNSAITNLTETACFNYDFAGQTLTMSGNYVDSLMTGNGCDSIVTLDLTIDSLDVSVTGNNDHSWTANETGSYQWLDCNDNFSPILGETSRTFIPATGGSFAVKISQNGCVDTSVCFVSTVGVNDDLITNRIHIYPNPNNGQFIIDFDMANREIVEIYNASGSLVFSQSLNQNKLLLTTDWPDGIYYLKINSYDNIYAKRLIIQK